MEDKALQFSHIFSLMAKKKFLQKRISETTEIVNKIDDTIQDKIQNTELKEWLIDLMNKNNLDATNNFSLNENKWQLLDFEQDEKGYFKITVENIDHRVYIGLNIWKPELHSTDWFSLSN